MTNQQLAHAIELHNSGVTWSVIAAYLKLDPTTLRKHIKNYEQQQQQQQVQPIK